MAGGPRLGSGRGLRLVRCRDLGLGCLGGEGLVGGEAGLGRGRLEGRRRGGCGLRNQADLSGRVLHGDTREPGRRHRARGGCLDTLSGRLGGLGHGPSATARRRVGGVRLRRGVVVGLVVRHGVVPTVVTMTVGGDGVTGDLGETVGRDGGGDGSGRRNGGRGLAGVLHLTRDLCLPRCLDLTRGLDLTGYLSLTREWCRARDLTLAGDLSLTQGVTLPGDLCLTRGLMVPGGLCLTWCMNLAGYLVLPRYRSLARNLPHALAREVSGVYDLSRAGDLVRRLTLALGLGLPRDLSLARNLPRRRPCRLSLCLPRRLDLPGYLHLARELPHALDREVSRADDLVRHLTLAGGLRLPGDLDLARNLPRRRRLSLGLRRRQSCRARVVGRSVRLGGREGEHRAGGRLLRGRALRRGGEGAPSSPVLLRGTRARRTLPGDRELSLRLGRFGGAARGQRRRQRVLFAAVVQRPTPGRHRHALRRHRPAETGTRGGGPGAVLAGHHHGTLGHTGLGGPSTAPTGTSGAVPVVAGGLRRYRHGLLPLGLGPPPAPPSGRHGFVGLGRDVGVQEGVGGGTPRPPPPAALGRGGLHGGGFHGGGLQRGRTGSRDGPRPTADGHFEDVRAAAHARHLVRLQHTAVSAHDPAHDRLVHRVSPAYGPRTSIRTPSPRCAAATTTVLSM